MTFSIQRPASTSFSLGITLVGGGGTVHATLADNSDATYAAMAHGAGIVDFATLSVPSGAIIRAVLRLRCRRSTTDTILAVRLDDDHDILFYPPTTGSSWATLSSIPQTNLTAAGLAAGVRMLFSTSGFADVAAAYLDVTSVPVPTLNVTAPTGTIAVSQPTVTWTYTGDYPQDRFQIKVFTSAQYSGAGFNVDSSTAIYDSGEHISSASSFVPSLNLPNTATYRFYVKVAQKVGAVIQWSAWDFTQPTVSVSAADVPVLAVTAQSLYGKIRIVATNGGSPAWDFVTIQRTSDGGATWTPVRSADRQPVSGTSFTVYDYESGNGELVQYRVQSVVGDPAGDIASEWSTATAPVAWTSPGTWLKSLTRPALNRTLYIQGIPTIRRRMPRGVIDVAGRSDPIVVSDTRKWDEGTITFITVTDAQRDGLNALFDTGETLLLQTPEEDGWGSRYIACGDVDENRPSRTSQEVSRTFTVPFNEVTAPVGQVITFGSAWDDLVAAEATWTTVIAAFPTWNAVIAAHF